MENSPGPLHGIRVLDFTRILAGPYATMALGELGADVVKVERPGTGDETRQWGPPFVAGESAYFLAVNRNKKSITADLERPHDRQRLETLALHWADVVVENFKPGTLERWGLGLKELREKNPRLITASVRGYPPGDDRPGFDFVIQAASGLMSLNGPENGEAYKVGVAIADITAGLYLLSGILAALWARQETGRGQHLTVSLWEAQLAWLSNVAESYLLTGEPPRRYGNGHPQLVPYQTFPCQDGPIAVAVGTDAQFQALCDILGHPEWAADIRFTHNPDRVRNRAALLSLLEPAFIRQPRAVWLERLDRSGIPAGPVATVPEAFAWATARGFQPVVTLEHPTVGTLPMVPLPWRFSLTPAAVRTPPPLLGQHDAEWDQLDLPPRPARFPRRTRRRRPLARRAPLRRGEAEPR